MVFDKFDTYNFVTNLIPGAALTFALGTAGFPTPAIGEFIPFAVVSFAVGAISNRLGSLVIDPVIRKLGWLQKKNYTNYIEASQKNRKLDAIVENANLYRTFATAGILYYLLIGIRWTGLYFGISNVLIINSLVVIAILVFILAYIRHDKYINQRVRPK